jgi:hypothetical protein
MIDFKLPVELPALDLSSALPLLALIIIAALILLTLLARSIVRSRLIAIVLIVALVMGGSSVIVGGLHALTGLLAVAGVLVLAVLALIARYPELRRLAHAVMENQRKPTLSQWPHVIDQPAQRQLPASGVGMRPSIHRARSRRVPRSLGF